MLSPLLVESSYPLGFLTMLSFLWIYLLAFVSLTLKSPIRGKGYWAFILKTLYPSEGTMEFCNLWTKFCEVTIQMKPPCLYFHMVLFVFSAFYKRNLEILVAFCHIWQRKGYRTKHFWSFRRLTHRNKEVMKLFTGVELVWVVKLVRWQEFAETFVVDIREGSHVLRKTRWNF